MAPIPYYPYSYIAAPQYQQPAYQPQYQQPLQALVSQNQQDNRNHSQGQRIRFDRKRLHRDPIPVSYAQLLPYRVQQGAIVPKEIPPATFLYHAKHNPNASCAYLAGHIGHSTEDCWPLQSRVHELIDQKVLSFYEAGPNVITNPLPDNCRQIVNTVSREDCSDSVSSSEEY
ncbi:hypothetical protein KIW84_062465 [Lathyrus oleraceus]|uniref:Uncharacterized protein n=1 Tax=Pisum sativum TaxID=3888 RepID=A0A9D4W8Z5_PEA|nr:hypothetical protein KIW84_062465 [Pisum sativum]